MYHSEPKQKNWEFVFLDTEMPMLSIAIDLAN